MAIDLSDLFGKPVRVVFSEEHSISAVLVKEDPDFLYLESTTLAKDVKKPIVVNKKTFLYLEPD